MGGILSHIGRPILQEKAIGRGILIALIVLSTINMAIATPQVKFYGEKQDYVYKYLEKYDTKGLKWILVFPEGYSSAYLGYFYPGQIRLFSSREDVFVHELAHQYDWEETKNFQRHTDNFYKKEAEIWASVS